MNVSNCRKIELWAHDAFEFLYIYCLLSIALQGKYKKIWYCEGEGFVSGPRGSNV